MEGEMLQMASKECQSIASCERESLEKGKSSI